MYYILDFVSYSLKNCMHRIIINNILGHIVSRLLREIKLLAIRFNIRNVILISKQQIKN